VKILMEIWIGYLKAELRILFQKKLIEFDNFRKVFIFKLLIVPIFSGGLAKIVVGIKVRTENFRRRIRVEPFDRQIQILDEKRVQILPLQHINPLEVLLKHLV
jgi:hypothetical protein